MFAVTIAGGGGFTMRSNFFFSWQNVMLAQRDQETLRKECFALRDEVYNLTLEK